MADTVETKLALDTLNCSKKHRISSFCLIFLSVESQHLLFLAVFGDNAVLS